MSILTKITKTRPMVSNMHQLSIPNLNTSHNDSLIVNKSFLPAYQNRGFSRIKARDERSVKGSRNINKELFQGTNPNISYLTRSRHSTQSKSSTKTESKFKAQRMKTPDLCLINSSKDTNQNAIVEESSSKTGLINLSPQIVYRNTEFTREDAYIMINVITKKCNEMINNSEMWIENNLLTKKIFDD